MSCACLRAGVWHLSQYIVFCERVIRLKTSGYSGTVPMQCADIACNPFGVKSRPTQCPNLVLQRFCGNSAPLHATTTVFPAPAGQVTLSQHPGRFGVQNAHVSNGSMSFKLYAPLTKNSDNGLPACNDWSSIEYPNSAFICPFGKPLVFCTD